ncbi:MAG: glycosyltransferase [Planctomycetota bacterium]|nr:glycosyltransferase [Planctomycetota bacterium]
MRLALTVDPCLPVPPRGYGGIERVVDLLVRGLVARGHEVTLVAHPESATPAQELIPYGVPPHASRRARARELAQVGRALWRGRRRFDVVHSFGRLAALVPILPLPRPVKLQSYQRDGVPWRSVAVASALAGRSLRFTGCSSAVYRAATAGTWSTVFNCVDPARYRLREAVAPDAPLVFLGRLEPIKGAHEAIQIAQRAGRRLVLAGNRVESGSARGYFDAQIAPHLDGARVRWVGEVDDAQKDALLGEAAALLMPIAWEEPFGIVMIEAMACGTPVIAYRRGSVPEVVRDGVNGFAVRGLGEAAAAVERLGAVDRAATRRECEARFGVAPVVDAYERLYERLLRGEG